jgi:hypothetical protein
LQLILKKQPALNVWIEGDDLPTYLPEPSESFEDNSLLADLLDRARHVFALAMHLGYVFQSERRSDGGIREINPNSWGDHQPTFNDYCSAVLSLREAMQKPPGGFEAVAQALLKAAEVAKRIRDVMQTAEGQRWAEYLDYFPDLNSVAAAGREAIETLNKAQRLDDPFAFVNQPTAENESLRPYSAKDFEGVRIVGYRTLTEIGRIVSDLNNPVEDLPTIDGEEVVPNPPQVERQMWLPILRGHIAKIPELAENLTEEKLRKWLWQEHKIPPTQDVGAESLVRIIEYDEDAPFENQLAEFRGSQLDDSEDEELSPRDGAVGGATKPSDAVPPVAPMKSPTKRSTERGEARVKLIAALTAHHRYADGGCLNQEPIGNNQLARAARVSPSSASTFFIDKFQGHTNYKTLCRDAGHLTAALKLLNDEFAPYHLLGAESDLATPDEEDTNTE